MSLRPTNYIPLNSTNPDLRFFLPKDTHTHRYCFIKFIIDNKRAAKIDTQMDKQLKQNCNGGISLFNKPKIPKIDSNHMYVHGD